MSVSNFVESVEYIEVAFSGSDTTNSGFLTKGQNYQNCVPFMTTHSSDDYHDTKLFDMYFSGTTSSGVINFDRANTRSSTATVKCYVVEFNPSQVSVQQGSFSITSGSTTDNVSIPTTLSGVNKTAVTFSWSSDDSSSVLSNSLIRGRISSTSNIEFYRGLTGGNCSGHWFIFEDKNDNFNVTHVNSNYTGTYFEVVDIDNTRCVDPTRTFILGSYANDGNTTYAARTTAAVGFASDGSVKNERQYSSYNLYWNCQIIEFLDTTKAYVLANVGFLPLNMSSSGSPYDINFFPACNTATSTVIVGNMQGIGEGYYNGSTANDSLFWSYEIVTSSGIRIEFNEGLNTTITASQISVIDWAGVTVTSGTNDSVIPEGTGVDQSFVKSVENLSINMTMDDTNVFLSKGQNWRNCVFFVSCRATVDDDNIKNHLVNVYFTDTGVLHLKKPANSLDRIVEISVVEFWPNQVKVQHKKIFTNNVNTTTIDIAPVSSTNKCFITNTIFPSESTIYTRDVLPRVNFTTTSGVDVYINNNASSLYQIDVAFFVAEDLSNNFVVLHDDSTLLSAFLDYSYDSSTHYDMTKTFPILSYTSDTTSAYASINFSGGYYDYEYRPIILYRYNSAANNTYWHGMAIKFLDNKKHVYNATINFTAAVDSITDTYPVNLLTHTNALSCFNIVQGSTFAVSYNNSTAVSHAFNTAKITNYTTGTFEVSRASAVDYGTIGGVVVIDWIGKIPTASGTQTKTKSIVQSLQSLYDSNSYYDTYFEIPLTKGQNADQCVPFVTNSCEFSSAYFYSTNFYKTVYRYDDGFLIRFASPRDHSQYVVNRDINIHIVEFNDNVTVQHGVVSTPNLSTTATINAVNLNRAFLIFYATVDDHDVNGNRSATICGRFSSTSELSFVRVFNTGNMTISWYVIECSEESNYWEVMHEYNTGLGGSGEVVITLDERPKLSRSLFFASWAMSGSASTYPPRSTYKGRHSYNNSVVFNKADTSIYNMDYCNVEVVEFTDALGTEGLRIVGVEPSFTSGKSLDVTINTISGSSFDLNKSIVWNMNAGNENEANTNSTYSWQNAFLCNRFKDEDTLTLTRGYSSYTTEVFSFICEFPEYNKYYMEGYVKEQDIPVAREVAAFRKATNQLIDTATSHSGTGYFLLETPYGDDHFVVAFDDEAGLTYNHLVYGQITPTVISGSFAYNEGITTTSGFEIGVPLGRL